MRLLIIGGSDAGISAGLRARECAPDVDVTVVVADAYPNFSICGLPFYLSGETPDWRDLAHRSRADLEAAGLELMLGTTATAIDADAHEVLVVDGRDSSSQLHYDRLVVATGAVPARPPIAGLDLPGVHVLHTMDHAFMVNRDLNGARRAVVVGGGYIGVEMADALTHRGLHVTLVEMAECVLTTVDPPLGSLIGDELVGRGVDVRVATTVDAIQRHGETLTVCAGEAKLPADVVIVAGGVRPNSALAASAGVSTGVAGALVTDASMRTNLPDVYAAGDCVETRHRLLDTPTYLPLGTTAHKQGRVAGHNAATDGRAIGDGAEFAGSLGTQVVKVFGRVAGRTGLAEDEAAKVGYRPRTIQVRVDDHKPYYPGATPLAVRLTADQDNGRLLGAQMVGHTGAQVAKRLDVLATALFHGMTVDALNDLDLSYTPPLSSPWDPVQLAAQAFTTPARPAAVQSARGFPRDPHVSTSG